MCFQNPDQFIEYVAGDAIKAQQGGKSQSSGTPTPAPKAPNDAAAAGGATPAGETSASDPTGFAALTIPRTTLPRANKNVASG